MEKEELIEYAIRTSNAIKEEFKQELIDYYYEQLTQLKKQQEIIDKTKEELKRGITFCKNDSQGSYDICNIAIRREQSILSILEDKEV